MFMSRVMSYKYNLFKKPVIFQHLSEVGFCFMYMGSMRLSFFSYCFLSISTMTMKAGF